MGLLLIMRYKVCINGPAATHKVLDAVPSLLALQEIPLGVPSLRGENPRGPEPGSVGNAGKVC